MCTCLFPVFFVTGVLVLFYSKDLRVFCLVSLKYHPFVFVLFFLCAGRCILLKSNGSESTKVYQYKYPNKKKLEATKQTFNYCANLKRRETSVFSTHKVATRLSRWKFPHLQPLPGAKVKSSGGTKRSTSLQWFLAGPCFVSTSKGCFLRWGAGFVLDGKDVTK